MGKTMPKWALRKTHEKHPLYPLYAARKLIHEQLASTKNYLHKLYSNKKYLYDVVQQEFNWYEARAVGPIDHRGVLIGVNEALISLPVLSFVALRYLQKDLNNIRKAVQDDGIGYLDKQIVGTFQENLLIFGKLITLDLWRAHRAEDNKSTNENLGLCKLVSSHTDSPCVVKHNTLQKDGVSILIQSLKSCQCFHQQEEAFLNIVFYLLQNPVKKPRFEPQRLSFCLTRIKLFHHLADTADMLLAGQTYGSENSCLRMGGLEAFVEDFVDNGPRLFDLEDPIEYTVEALEFCIGREKHSQEHIDHSTMWILVLKYLKIAQKESDIDSSDFSELLDIFHHRESTQCIMSQARKCTRRRKPENQSEEKEKDREIEVLPPQSKEIAKHEEIRLNDGFNKNGSDQSRQEVVAQTRRNINESVGEDQLTNKMKTMSKYNRRGYGKCENDCGHKMHSYRTDTSERIQRISSSEHYHSVWRVIFPQTRHDRQVSRVSWPLFVEAMTSQPVNCRVKKSDGLISSLREGTTKEERKFSNIMLLMT